jgi:hypothetical protein
VKPWNYEKMRRHLPHLQLPPWPMLDKLVRKRARRYTREDIITRRFNCILKYGAGNWGLAMSPREALNLQTWRRFLDWEG